MGSTTPPDLERTEIELVLQSGLFAKAPRLERFFRYICERHLEGEGDRIKEYSIAIEALGRPSEFDPKRDSIVRVEAHRLRKRLEEFYEGPGAGHAIRISVPSGQYRPHFMLQAADGAATSPSAGQIPHEANLLEPNQNEPNLREPAEFGIARFEAAPFETVDLVAFRDAPPQKRRRRLASILWISFCLLFAAGGLAAWWSVKNRPARAKPPASARAGTENWTAPAAAGPIPVELRMLAGYQGPPVTDRQGHTWVSDAFYRGGVSSAIAADRVLPGQPYAQFLKSRRAGKFTYDIPLRQTTYELHLYMVETEYGSGNPMGGGEATRLFQVSINGKVKLSLFDPLAEAGAPNRLYERVFKDIRPGPDGHLHLAFDPNLGGAFLNAIKLVPSAPGRIHPIRIVAQDNPVTDSEGRLWAGDEYFLGGASAFRDNVVVNSREPLYQGERYGNFCYRIPLASGRYRLTLHFAETWFGTPQSRLPAANARIFDVFANGVALLRNYQVAKDASGSNRCVVKVFDGLQPNAQGLLLIEFVPVKNYAEVNAIEVVETG